ncbi:F0F1 ATP synthase subunit delta [Campylobacter corcagiensis]|uniref:ATP synthase subunit delta n=1 Tax=Campylobacter corcagiensis TaxID=1448857 RepID=A0A7M1LDK2_9BACT|nr:F0F1 ATP synthase subunit delta [Campylobacter corcagiensis]QKF65249.1 ATP synthase, F1 complex, delta subunit [Campylobacter corcagiensis]QOQ86618.1 F0F1 ATP synthase subunit delta [Campylobacter corcagiensis]
MSKVISDKYIAAILSSFDKSELDKAISNLEVIATAFKDNKFSGIINSPLVDDAKKEELVLSLVKDSDEKFQNLIKILSKNSRLVLIPKILNGINFRISSSKNEYSGTIYSKDSISSQQIEELESLLSKKFDSKISLNYKKSDYNGVKIDLESLGSEISFSLDRLKQGISEYILKAI